KAAEEMAAKMLDAANGLGQSFGGIFKGLIDRTLSWKDAALKAISSVLQYLNQANLAQGGKGLFGGGLFEGLIGGFLGLGFAKGGVFQDGLVQAFAKGGVVTRPTVFPFAEGIGLMGEAGPEAIMPLHRGPDGSLGVKAVNQSQPLRIESVCRFAADGGMETGVWRTSRPIAQQESAVAVGLLAKNVPAIVDRRVDTRQTRGTRP